MLVEAVRYKQTLNIQSHYFYSQQKPSFKIRHSPTVEKKYWYEYNSVCVLWFYRSTVRACQEQGALEGVHIE